MLSLIKFIITAAIWIFVIRLLVRKRTAAQKSGSGGSSGNQQGEDSRHAAGSGPDISLWRKTASELSGKITSPFDKSGLGLAITGKIDNRPYRIEYHGDGKIFYSLTLPYAPPAEARTFPIRCVSDNAIIGENSIFLLCPGTAPNPAVIRELAAHAERLITTIPFEDESAEDKPEAAFLRKRDIEIIASAPARKIKEPAISVPEPVIEPEPAAEPEPEPGPAEAEPAAEPESGPAEQQDQEASPSPAGTRSEEKEEAGETLSPESLAEVLFRSSLPGPAEKEYFASLTGRRVEWEGKVRMAYEISSDFVFGRVKGVKVQMDLCTVAGKYGRQTLRATAVFPPESYAVLRTSSNKSIRFRGTILKLEAFSREVYLTEGELL